MRSPPPKTESRKVPMLLQLGCAQLLAMIVVTSLLLVVDTLVVSAAYQSWREYRGAQIDNPRIVQSVLILGPLLLLFLQYWLYDRVRNFLFPTRLDEKS